MSLVATDLRSMWERNSAAYRTREIGSGVQRFVKECLDSLDLFALHEGEPATPTNAREGEYIVEKATRAARSADIVIYMDADVLVPVEVERFGSIERGVKQLRQYQLDLRKKLGVLTDGFEWRFYNNRVYRAFNLYQILDDPGAFRAYWRSYVQPERYYVDFFSTPDFDSLPLADSA